MAEGGGEVTSKKNDAPSLPVLFVVDEELRSVLRKGRKSFTLSAGRPQLSSVSHAVFGLKSSLWPWLRHSFVVRLCLAWTWYGAEDGKKGGFWNLGAKACVKDTFVKEIRSVLKKRVWAVDNPGGVNQT